MSEAANGEGTAPQITQAPTPETPPTTPPPTPQMEPPPDISTIAMVEVRSDQTPHETKNFGYRDSSE